MLVGCFFSFSPWKENKPKPSQCLLPPETTQALGSMFGLYRLRKKPCFGEKPAGNGTGVVGTPQPPIAVGCLAWGGKGKGEGRGFGVFLVLCGEPG